MTTGQGPAPAGLKTLAASLVPSRIVAISSTAPGGRPGHLSAALAAAAAFAGLSAGLSAASAPPQAKLTASAEASAKWVSLVIWSFPPSGSGARAGYLSTASAAASARRDALQPCRQVGDHLGAVGLVEHLVTAARIDLHLDIGEARVAVAADQRLQQRQVLVDGVLVAHEDVDRQVLADLADLGRIAHPGGQPAEAAVAAGLAREAAERVGYVGVDLGGIARQPVEGRARRLAVEADLIQPARPIGAIAEGRGAGQHQAVDRVRVVEDEGLGEEGAQAVAEQDQRQVGMLGAGE